MDEGSQADGRHRMDARLTEEISEKLQRFRSHRAIIGIVGLGYVGLPLACAIARKGFSVLGFDIDSIKVDQINAGVSYIGHIGSSEISEMCKVGRLAATGDFSRVGELDAILLCVPTPLSRHREPDLTYVVKTTESIAPFVRSGQLIVLEFDNLSRHDTRRHATDSGAQWYAFRPRLLPCIRP